MSTVSSGSKFYVFKFESTGLEALLDETLELLREGLDEKFGFDRDSIRFERVAGEIRFVFDMLPTSSPLTLADAPFGSIVTIGNPRNGITAWKNRQGKWVYTHNGFGVSYDDLYKTAQLIWSPR